MTAMSPADVGAIFAAVKDAATKTAWAKGVALARTAQLAFDRAEGDDWYYHVTTPSNGVVYTCMVNAAEEDWHCSCDEADDPCLHIVALVIGLQKSGGKIAAPTTKPLALGYFFSSHQDGSGAAKIHCDRGFFDPDAKGIVEPQHWQKATLKAASRAGSAATRVQPADLELDPWLCHLGLSHADGEAIPATSMASIFALLTVHNLPCFWQGRRATIHKTPFPELITIRDASPKQAEGGVVVALGGAGSSQRFANGAVLSTGPDGSWQLWLPPQSAGAELPPEARWLREGRVFKPYELAYLVSEVLPALAERFTADSQSANLPVLVKERPRPAFYTEAEGDELIVTPKLLYGDPPLARVEKKALVLEGKECPERDRSTEYAITDAMGRKLAMVPGDELRFRGPKAITMAERIESFAARHGGLLFSRHPQTGRWRQERGRKGSGPSVTAGQGLSGIGQFHTHSQVVPHITLGGSDFSLRFEVDGAEVPAAKVLGAYQEGKQTMALPGGGFAPLPMDWLQRFGPVLAQLWQAKQMAADESLPRSLWPSYAQFAGSLDATFTASEQVTALAAELSSEPDAVPLPKGLEATLRPYQQEGYSWLKLRQRHGLGAVLADDMGLGKTLQTICLLPKGAVSLVVCPTSVLFNWQRELARFRPQLSVALYHGAKRDLPKLRQERCEVIITSYGTLRRDIAALAAISWAVVVLDEAQTIKNPASQVSQASYQLSAKFKLALTGTPIENTLLDLWSQFHFLLPGFLGDHKPFAAALGSDTQAEQVAMLKQQIAPYILRRTKSQVLTDLPEKIESIVYYELDAAERERYEALFAASQPKVQKLLLAGGKLEILEIILRLRQACCHPGLGQPGQHSSSRSDDVASDACHAGKLRPLLAKLAQIQSSRGGKSLVFSQWTGFLDIIESRLTAEGYATCRLDGQTKDRGKVVAAFQEDPAIQVMLISLKAGSTGLNLTAAENVFIMDPWWNPAIENQAADRAYRIGQKNTVQVFRIVALDTIEENIVVLKDAKQKLADATISPSGSTEEPTAAAANELPDLASLFTRDTSVAR